MSNSDVVTLMAKAVDHHRAELASAGVDVRVRLSSGEAPGTSLRLDAESTRALAHVVLYATGDMNLVIGDAGSGAVILDEHRVITSEVGIHDALETIRHHLSTV